MIDMFPVNRTLDMTEGVHEYVAIANLHEGHIPTHAAIIINYKEELILFHYTGYDIEYSIVSDEYYHRVTKLIAQDEIPSFIALCKNIQKKANPSYGFFYSGESYDTNGDHLSNSDTGERMTCVGFCLNVLKGFLEADYIEYSDWTEASHEDDQYLERYCTNHQLEIESIRSSHRRINPRECLASAFFNNLPIQKVDIDEKVQILDTYFGRLFSSEEE